MGQAASTPSAAQPAATQQEEQEIMKEIERTKDHVDKTLVDNINNLNQILEQFKSNDTKSMIDKIKKDNVLLQNYNSLSPDEKEKYKYKLKLDDSLLTKLEDIHMNVLNNLDYTFADVKTKGKLGDDKNLQQYIQGFVDKDLDLRMKDYLQNPFIQGDPVVARSMADVTNSIKTIRGKYKYFEYKYVQMNLFLMVFINYVNNTMRQYIDETAAFYAARQKYHLVLIQNVIKTFQSQLGDEAKKMTDIDIENFTVPLSQLTNEITKSILENKKIAEVQKSENLSKILSFIMEREEDFAEKIVKSADKFKEQSAIRNREARMRGAPSPDLIRKMYTQIYDTPLRDDYIYTVDPTTQTIVKTLRSTATREQKDLYDDVKRRVSVQKLDGVSRVPQRDITGRFLPSRLTREQGVGVTPAQLPLFRGGNDDILEQGGEQVGGFIRDGSWLPKNFYEI